MAQDVWFAPYEWEQVKADLSLQPMPPHAREVVESLLAGDVIGFPTGFSYKDAALLRLDDLGLIDRSDGYDEFGDDEVKMVASCFLTSIEGRGLLDELLRPNT